MQRKRKNRIERKRNKILKNHKKCNVKNLSSNTSLNYTPLRNYGYCPIKLKITKQESCSATKLNNCNISIMCDQWLVNKKPYVKKSTYSHYFTVVNKHIIPFFLNFQPQDINSSSIQLFTSELLRCLKPKTVRDILSITKQIVEYAEYCGVCHFNNIVFKMPKVTNIQTDTLSITEQQNMIDFLNEDTDLHKLGVLICLYTGLRLGEICGLKWEDIDFNERIIKIRRTVQRIRSEHGGTEFLTDSPKTQKSVRDIPIPNFLYYKLLSFNKYPIESYVLTGTASFTQPRTYQNKFKSYLKTCKLAKEYHFHTLRHTFASRAIELGFDPKTLSEILGHSNVNITLNRYVHTSMNIKRNNMELFSPTNKNISAIKLR